MWEYTRNYPKVVATIHRYARTGIRKAELLTRLEVFFRFRDQSEQYRLMFENAPVGMYRSTPDGRLVMANPALVRMLGYESFDELARGA